VTSFNQIEIRHKVGLLNLVAALGYGSKTRKVIGLSSGTFYRNQAAMTEGGVEALLESCRKKPDLKDRM
jgi:hypothetical protein